MLHNRKYITAKKNKKIGHFNHRVVSYPGYSQAEETVQKVILDQTGQNRYQTVPFDVYIHNLMFGFILE